MAQANGQQISDYVENNVLTEGETIVWRGRPNPVAAAKMAWLHILVGVATLAFAAFWLSGVPSNGWAVADLFGIVIVGAGLFELSRPLINYIKAGKLWYAITDKRVLLLSAGNTFKVTSITRSDMTDFDRTDRADGTGDIRFRRSTGSRHFGPRATVEVTDGMWGIADIKGAAEAIDALRGANA